MFNVQYAENTGTKYCTLSSCEWKLTAVVKNIEKIRFFSIDKRLHSLEKFEMQYGIPKLFLCGVTIFTCLMISDKSLKSHKIFFKSKFCEQNRVISNPWKVLGKYHTFVSLGSSLCQRCLGRNLILWKMLTWAPPLTNLRPDLSPQTKKLWGRNPGTKKACQYCSQYCKRSIS